METELNIVKEILTLWGPLALGWIVAGFLGWVVFRERKKPTPEKELTLHDALEVIRDNTKVLQHLATLIEERTKR